MTILFTGGATGGHFYPLIAVAEEISRIVQERHLVPPKLHFTDTKPFDQEALFENQITFHRIPAGKIRRYFSIHNVTGIFTTLWGILIALITLFRIYPDVVFSRGGYSSVPTTVAARILGIPVVLHESDVRPGLANKLAAHWAIRIAITFPQTAKLFSPKVQDKIAQTGTPIRRALHYLDSNGARELLGIEDDLPVVLILTGSLGSQYINQVVVESLKELLKDFHVIHQTGKNHFETVRSRSNLLLEDSQYKNRYHPFAYLNSESLRRAAAIATLVISRAGSGAIAEFALWGKPVILIPIPESISHDQRTNAYAYAQTGAAVVLEQENMTASILTSEIRRIMTSKETLERMSAAGKSFAHPDAGRVIAGELIRIGLSHEQQ